MSDIKMEPEIGAELLRPRDAAFLTGCGYRFEASNEANMVCLVVTGFPLPGGGDTVDLLMRLPPGFPDQAPDMFWCDPPVIGASAIAGTEAREDHVGRSWQRWSRHFVDTWRPGIDDLGSLIARVRRCLADGLGVEP